MRHISKEDKAGIYITVIVHLGVLIVMLLLGLDYSIRHENSFVLDFSKMEEMERMQQEVEKLQKEAELQQAINNKLNEVLSQNMPSVRNVAVDRASLKDDRGTDANQLYKDAERLAKDLKSGFDAPDDDHADISKPEEKEGQKQEKPQKYSGPSVASYELEGRKASKLPIPAYRCMGAGEVTVIITVDPAGNVLAAKVDESCSSADGCLRSFAVRSARLSKFSASTTAPPKQIGNIVYKFIAQ